MSAILFRHQVLSTFVGAALKGHGAARRLTQEATRLQIYIIRYVDLRS